MRLILQNTGNEEGLNVNATISSSNSYITITNDFQDCVTIQSGSTGTSASNYMFKINSSCSADYLITLD